MLPGGSRVSGQALPVFQQGRQLMAQSYRCVFPADDAGGLMADRVPQSGNVVDYGWRAMRVGFYNHKPPAFTD